MSEITEEQLAAAAKGPRVTSSDVYAAIVSDQYHHFPGTTHTVCCLTLKNGHTVVGDSACVIPANFNEEIGRQLAYEKAVDKVWEVLGYELRTEISGSCRRGA